MRQTKTLQVLQYLQEHGSITSMEAIQHFGATRLSAIVFNLKKQGYEIYTRPTACKDRNGNTCNFATYIMEK